MRVIFKQGEYMSIKTIEKKVNKSDTVSSFSAMSHSYCHLLTVTEHRFGNWQKPIITVLLFNEVLFLKCIMLG